MEVLNIKDLKSGVILFGHTVQYISFLTESVQFLESADVVKICETMQTNIKNVCKICKIGYWQKNFFRHWPAIHKNMNLQNGEKLNKL